MIYHDIFRLRPETQYYFNTQRSITQDKGKEIYSNFNRVKKKGVDRVQNQFVA